MSFGGFPEIRNHPSEDLLEEYSFERLEGKDLARVEQHLLVCQQCRDSLAKVENFIALMKVELRHEELAHRSAAETPRATFAPPSWRNAWGLFGMPALPRTLMAGAVAGCAVLIAVAGIKSRRVDAPEVHVMLATLRGADPGGTAHVSAKHPLDLTLDSSQLPSAGGGPAYALEIVDASGGTQWRGSSRWAGGGLLRARVPRLLPPGLYWVRLYSESGNLIREYGLRLDE